MKIKFRALCLTALVVVMAFASMASADLKLLGVNTAGDVKTITIDASGNKTEEDVTATLTQQPTQSSRFYSYDGGVLAVYAGDSANKTLGKAFLFDVDSDGKVTYKNNATIDLGESTKLVKGVLYFEDAPVFYTQNKLVKVDGTTITSFDISVDVAFMYNSELFVIGARSGDATTNVDMGVTTATDKASNIDVNSGDVIREITAFTKKALSNKEKMALLPTAQPLSRDAYLAPTAVLGKIVYIASDDTFLAMVMPDPTSGIINNSALKAGELKQLPDANGTYFALYADEENNTLYAVESADKSNFDLVSMKITYTNSDNTIVRSIEKTALVEDISADLGAKMHAGSFGSKSVSNVSLDMYASGNLVVVVNHGFGFAVYDIEAKKCIASSDKYTSVAMIAAKAESDGSDGDGKGTTVTNAVSVVDVASMTDDAAKPYITSLAGSSSSVTKANFLAEANVTKSADISSATVSDAVKEALANEAAKVEGYKMKDGSAKGLKSFTIDKAGYIVFTASAVTALDASKYVAVAVDANGNQYPVTLLDSTGNKATTTVAAAGLGELPAGDYEVYYAEIEEETSGDGDTGSSSSGCDAGFGLMSLAALLAVTTISKRR